MTDPSVPKTADLSQRDVATSPQRFPIPLNAEQERTVKAWAADDRLWTTQETVEINLRTFARKILASQPDVTGPAPAHRWQDIETAPKDGTKILVHEPKNGGQLRFVWWESYFKCWMSIPGRITVRPTHWMALPDSPTKEPS